MGDSFFEIVSISRKKTVFRRVVQKLQGEWW